MISLFYSCSRQSESILTLLQEETYLLFSIIENGPCEVLISDSHLRFKITLLFHLLMCVYIDMFPDLHKEKKLFTPF